MKRNRTIIFTTLLLTTLACNMLINTPFSNVKNSSTEILLIDEPIPASVTITDASVAMAAGSAALALAGVANIVLEGRK